MELTKNIRVAIVEDDTLILSSLQQIIHNSDGFNVVSCYTNAEDAIKSITDANPDVLLLDIDLPGISGVKALPKLKKNLPDLNIVMLTIHEESELVFTSLERGAVGYLLKSTNPNLILNGIREVYKGGAPMSPSIARKIIASFQPNNNNQLTERELEILQELSNGANNKKIAEDLFISTNTVKAHIKNIYKKMHVHSRAEAVSKAIKKRIL